MDNNSHNKCLICNSSSLENLEVYKHAYLVKCKTCKFIFSKKKDQLIDHYNGYGRNDYLSPITIIRYNELI